jgi:hypothetical protein
MHLALTSRGIRSPTSPLNNGTHASSPTRDQQRSGADSPVRLLFSDDRQLQDCEEQSDAAVLQQLVQWTAQVLQRLLRAAESATWKARGDLRAAVDALVEERNQYVP